MTAEEEWKVGQRVWLSLVCVRERLTEGEITKVGRRWVHVKGAGTYRFPRGSRRLEGKTGVGPGTVFRSVGEYEDMVRLSALRARLQTLSREHGIWDRLNEPQLLAIRGVLERAASKKGKGSE